MAYKILADIVVFVHFLWILFLILGVLWGIRSTTVKIIHTAAWAFAITIQVFNWYCPLTHLETWLRAKHDPALSYSGSFIPHYLEKVIYIDIPPVIILVASFILAGVSLWFYLKKGK